MMTTEEIIKAIKSNIKGKRISANEFKSSKFIRFSKSFSMLNARPYIMFDVYNTSDNIFKIRRVLSNLSYNDIDGMKVKEDYKNKIYNSPEEIAKAINNIMVIVNKEAKEGSIATLFSD